MDVYKRTDEMPPFESAMLRALYQQVKNTPKDGEWRVFKGKLRIKDRLYEIECEFRIKGDFLQIAKQYSEKIDKNFRQHLHSKLILPDYMKNDR